jgi:hypothetical protein
MLNIVYADILGFIKPGELQSLWAGQAGVHITQAALVGFAILLEVPIAMIFVSRILKPGLNRWANTVAVVVTTAFVTVGGSIDLHHLYYVFFAAVEVACMALIVWSVWSRRDPVGAGSPTPARGGPSFQVGPEASRAHQG